MAQALFAGLVIAGLALAGIALALVQEEKAGEVERREMPQLQLPMPTRNSAQPDAPHVLPPALRLIVANCLKEWQYRPRRFSDQ